MTRVSLEGGDWTDFGGLLRAQLAAAARQARYAASSSPYYRSLLSDDFSPGKAWSLAEFSQLVPELSKSTIIDLQRSDPPYGGLLAVPEDRIVRHYAYPTGQVLAWSEADHAMHLDQYASGLRTAGVTAADRIDITFQFAFVAAGTIWDAAARHLGAAVLPGGAGESARHAVAMKMLRTTCLIGFATFLHRIADSASEQGIDPARDLSVEKLIIVGEWHGSDAKARLSDRFGGASVREAYGTVETGLVAAECTADPAAMHVHPDFLIEVRDPASGALVEPGDGGELYITPLFLRAMPVLRYRTGDITEFVRTETCGCGRSTPRIGRIVGRVGQYLRVKGVFLNRTGIEAVLRGVSGELAGFHLTVDRPQGLDRLRLCVEGPDSLPKEATALMVRKMKERASVAVEVTIVPFGTFSAEGPWFTDDRA